MNLQCNIGFSSAFTVVYNDSPQTYSTRPVLYFFYGKLQIRTKVERIVERSLGYRHSALPTTEHGQYDFTSTSTSFSPPPLFFRSKSQTLHHLVCRYLLNRRILLRWLKKQRKIHTVFNHDVPGTTAV